MVLYDIKTPQHLKSFFSGFCPFFKSVEVGREDINALMEKFALDNNLLSKPQKINHGLEATKIYEVIQYLPVKCFENFGLEVSEARRSGDSDPKKAVLAQTFNLHFLCVK